MNYDDCLDQAIDEKRVNIVRHYPADNFSPEFDFLFLGSQTGAIPLPMTVCSFLEMLPAKGKIIAPFCVHGTGGLARTSAELRRCARNAKILPTLSINRDDLAHSEQTVKEWALYALKSKLSSTKEKSMNRRSILQTFLTGFLFRFDYVLRRWKGS